MPGRISSETQSSCALFLRFNLDTRPQTLGHRRNHVPHTSFALRPSRLKSNGSPRAVPASSFRSRDGRPGEPSIRGRRSGQPVARVSS
eukprot:s2858_g2.t1